MHEIQLQLTLPEVNQILDALGEKPYKQVYQLIVKIQQQAHPQLEQSHQPASNSRPELVSE
jgi:hypothetical protein